MWFSAYTEDQNWYVCFINEAPKPWFYHRNSLQGLTWGGTHYVVAVRDQGLNLVPGTLFYPPKSPCSGGTFQKYKNLGGGTCSDEHFWQLKKTTEALLIALWQTNMELQKQAYGWSTKQGRPGLIEHQSSEKLHFKTAVAFSYMSRLVYLSLWVFRPRWEHTTTG